MWYEREEPKKEQFEKVIPEYLFSAWDNLKNDRELTSEDKANLQQIGVVFDKQPLPGGKESYVYEIEDFSLLMNFLSDSFLPSEVPVIPELGLSFLNDVIRKYKEDITDITTHHVSYELNFDRTIEFKQLKDVFETRIDPYNKYGLLKKIRSVENLLEGREEQKDSDKGAVDAQDFLTQLEESSSN